MTDKEKVINELKEALDSLDITNKYRLNLIRAIEYLQEEPASEDLEEAASNYAEEHRIALMDYESGEVEMNKSLDVVNAFKVGAQWQKEQLMAKAIDGLVVCNKLTHGFKDILMEIPSYLNVDDKVKVIVIKED